MKNRRLKISCTVILLLIILTTVIFFIKKNNKLIQSQEVQENLANYIWDNSTENNTWMCFRKTFHIDKNEIKDIGAQIAVDSKYWLYINGEMVIREGALKRGETPDSIYYDEVDLSRLFK